MDTAASSSRKRAGSDSENSDTNVTSSKKHHVSGRPATVSKDYKDDQNQNVKVEVVNIQSEKVNLGKINPIIIAKTINDLVCFVHKVQKTKYKRQSIKNLKQIYLQKKRNLDNTTVNFQLKTVTKPNTK